MQPKAVSRCQSKQQLACGNPLGIGALAPYIDCYQKAVNVFTLWNGVCHFGMVCVTVPDVAQLRWPNSVDLNGAATAFHSPSSGLIAIKAVIVLETVCDTFCPLPQAWPPGVVATVAQLVTFCPAVAG